MTHATARHGDVELAYDTAVAGEAATIRRAS